MALFFDFRVQSPIDNVNYTNLKYHKDYILLAALSFNEQSRGTVQIFTDEGENLREAFMKNAYAPLTCDWHPTKKLLVVGWETGTLTQWSPLSKRVEHIEANHDNDIVYIIFSGNGKTLFVLDSDANVSIWGVIIENRVSFEKQFNIRIPLPTGTSIVSCLYKVAYTMDTDDESTQPAARQANRPLTSRRPKTAAGGRPKTAMLREKAEFNSKAKELAQIVFAVDKGAIYAVSDNGRWAQLTQTSNDIRIMLYSASTRKLIVVSNNLIMTIFAMATDTTLTELTTAKLGGKAEKFNMISAGISLIAFVSGEPVVRMLDLEKDENYVLHINQQKGYSPTKQHFQCLTFNDNKNILMAGSDDGVLATWKMLPPKLDEENRELQWSLLQMKDLSVEIIGMVNGGDHSSFATNHGSEIIILSEQSMICDWRYNVTGLQIAPNVIHFVNTKLSIQKEERFDMTLRGVSISDMYCCVWNGNKVKTFQLLFDSNVSTPENKLNKVFVAEFTCDSHKVILIDNSLLTLENEKVFVRMFNGTVKQTFKFNEMEGNPIITAVNNSNAVIGTSNGIIKVYHSSEKGTIKQSSHELDIKISCPGLSKITSLSVNSDGTKVAFNGSIIVETDAMDESRLYVWDVANAIVRYFDFEYGLNDIDAGEDSGFFDEDVTSDQYRSKNEFSREVAGRYPLTHVWDRTYNYVLMCEAVVQANLGGLEGQDLATRMQYGPKKQLSPSIIVTLFLADDKSLLINDFYGKPEQFVAFYACDIPYHYFISGYEDNSDRTEDNYQNKVENVKKVYRPKMSKINIINNRLIYGDKDQPYDVEEVQQNRSIVYFSPHIAAKLMKNFVGVSKIDESMMSALIQFNYYLTQGNMDEAYKSIKSIRKEAIWENMAKMCVKTKRIDVARECLGYMKHARAAAAINALGKGDTTDVKIGTLAIELGMKEEAKELLQGKDCASALNAFYQNSGRFTEAIDVAEKSDRIHLKTTHYNYGKYIQKSINKIDEESNEFQLMLKQFEAAEVTERELPNFYLTKDEILKLTEYAKNTNAHYIYRWLGKYYENEYHDETEALDYYNKGEDFENVVRILLNNGKEAEAKNLADRDPKACLILGKYYIKKSKVKEAINMYRQAGATTTALRLCRDNNMTDYLMSIALQSSEADMLNTAYFFEKEPGYEDKAIILYHKAGQVDKAIELALKAKKYEALNSIVESLDENSDPDIVITCAKFFMKNDQFDKAVNLLTIIKEYELATNLIHEHHIPVNDELIEKLTPLDAEPNTPEAKKRLVILEKLGDAAFEQGRYHVATQKYTQSGNKLSAMKALLKSGDTKKIIMFANVIRQKETYILAANYLQSTKWRDEQSLMNDIIRFYLKGEAYESLANFYLSCGESEIDEYHNYEKAIAAMNEGLKTMEKIKDPAKSRSMIEQTRQIMTKIAKFLKPMKLYPDNSNLAIDEMKDLLKDQNVLSVVRPAHIYGVIIQHYADKKDNNTAYKYIEEFTAKYPNMPIDKAIPKDKVISICTELGKPIPKMKERNMKRRDSSFEGFN
ncbi:hypothetical protein SNEBB_007594 [Seison nebaliae]|nr:hypothetical protein SNEBB_007594 [Seison nebaliae]